MMIWPVADCRMNNQCFRYKTGTNLKCHDACIQSNIFELRISFFFFFFFAVLLLVMIYLGGISMTTEHKFVFQKLISRNSVVIIVVENYLVY